MVLYFISTNFFWWLNLKWFSSKLDVKYSFNSYELRKENLNSDGQQFHKYQQNEQ